MSTSAHPIHKLTMWFPWVAKQLSPCKNKLGWQHFFFLKKKKKKVVCFAILLLSRRTREQEWSLVTSIIPVTAHFGRMQATSLATILPRASQVHYAVCREWLWWAWFSVFFQSVRRPTHPPTSVLTLYRPISQLLEDLKLAFALKEQYLNNYKRYHQDRHTVGKVFSLRIRWWKV